MILPEKLNLFGSFVVNEQLHERTDKYPNQATHYNCICIKNNSYN